MKMEFMGVMIDTQSLLFNVDSYKVGMFLQSPENTQEVYSYISSRGGIHAETVILGQAEFIKNTLSKRITKEEVEVASAFWNMHGLPFPREQLLKMVEEWNGWWPVEFRAVPEGTVVPVGNVIATTKSMDSNYFFVNTWVETAALRSIWYPSTVATNSREIKKVIKQYLEETGDVSGLDFKLHDFGFRGVSSHESGLIGGAAHLTIFRGSDTAAANMFIMDNYGYKEMRGFSIPASEHSTITSWGREGEFDAYKNMIDKHPEGALLACVSDSYNIYEACAMWGLLADQIKAKNQTLVVRPDSGNPLEVLPEVFKILSSWFGGKINEKGYAVMNNVRVIWGDGINAETIKDILAMLKKHGYSADNIAFGMGGALLQGVVRDDQKWAMKASYARIDGKNVEVFKDPITDPGKASLKGKVDLFKDANGKFFTAVKDCPSMESELELMYSPLFVAPPANFDDVVARAAI